MKSTDTVFAGSVPDIYESHMVPMLFAALAADMAERAASHIKDRVLEIAAGTGVVTRVLAPMLRPDARYWVTDLNPDMLAKAKALQPPDPRLTFAVADVADLRFEDAAFNAVVCQAGVMFFPDRVAAYREVRRVLPRKGAFLFSAWDSLAENEVPNVVSQALASFFPDDPPVFMARTPHGYHDVDRIYEDVEAAGFAETQIDTLTLQSPVASARAAAVALCQGTPLRGEILARNKDGLEEATAHAERAVAARWGEGPFTSSIQAHVVTALA